MRLLALWRRRSCPQPESLERQLIRQLHQLLDRLPHRTLLGGQPTSPSFRVTQTAHEGRVFYSVWRYRTEMLSPQEAAASVLPGQVGDVMREIFVIPPPDGTGRVLHTIAEAHRLELDGNGDTTVRPQKAAQTRTDQTDELDQLGMMDVSISELHELLDQLGCVTQPPASS
jgi:hypothetical protein